MKLGQTSTTLHGRTLLDNCTGVNSELWPADRSLGPTKMWSQLIGECIHRWLSVHLSCTHTPSLPIFGLAGVRHCQDGDNQESPSELHNGSSETYGWPHRDYGHILYSLCLYPNLHLASHSTIVSFLMLPHTKSLQRKSFKSHTLLDPIGYIM